MGKKARKGLVAGVGLWMATAAFFAGWAPKAYGAKESSVIETLTVTFQTTYGEQEEIPDPEITVSGDGCSLGDVQFRTEYDKWKPGKKVRAEVTVHADGGKVFPVSLNRSKCKVTGAEFVSAKALDDDTLQVKVDYTPVTVLGNTSGRVEQKLPYAGPLEKSGLCPGLFPCAIRGQQSGEAPDGT